jgi:hypothetical protein
VIRKAGVLSEYSSCLAERKYPSLCYWGDTTLNAACAARHPFFVRGKAGSVGGGPTPVKEEDVPCGARLRNSESLCSVPRRSQGRCRAYQQHEPLDFPGADPCRALLQSGLPCLRRPKPGSLCPDWQSHAPVDFPGGEECGAQLGKSGGLCRFLTEPNKPCSNWKGHARPRRPADFPGGEMCRAKLARNGGLCPFLVESGKPCSNQQHHARPRHAAASAAVGQDREMCRAKLARTGGLKKPRIHSHL